MKMTKESIKYLQEKLSKCNDENLRRAFEIKIKALKEYKIVLK